MAQPRTKRKRRRGSGGAVATGAGAAGLETVAIVEGGDAGGPSPAVPAAIEEPTVDLARERARGYACAVAAIGSLLLTFGSVAVASSGPRINAPSGSDRALLLGVSTAGGAQVTAMWMRVASSLLLIVVAWFLYGAIRGRSTEHFRWVPWLGGAAFVIIAVSTAVGFFEVRHAAHVFVASGGVRTEVRAHHLLALQRDKGPLRAADIGQLVGAIMFGVWISVTSYEAMRVGLLTRFLGIFGIGAGFTTVVGIPIATGLFAGWLGSVGILAAGYWPGGRPPAWDAGCAVPWDQVVETTRGFSRTGRDADT